MSDVNTALGSWLAGHTPWFDCHNQVFLSISEYRVNQWQTVYSDLWVKYKTDVPFSIYTEESSYLKDSVLISLNRNKENELAGLMASRGDSLLHVYHEYHVDSLWVLMKLHGQCLAIWLSFCTNWLTLFSFFSSLFITVEFLAIALDQQFSVLFWTPWRSKGPD